MRDPIPIPLSQRWRMFKSQALPVLVFSATTLAAVHLWQNHVVPPVLIGQVESSQATVTSVFPGMLHDLRVERFQQVKAGDPVVTVLRTDPKLIESSLDVFRGEIEVLRAGASPLLNRDRNRLNLEQLNMDWLDQRVQLASAKAKAQYALSELMRIEALVSDVNNPIASRQEYELAKRDYQALQEEVLEREKLVRDVGQSLTGLRTMVGAADSSADEKALRGAIAVQEANLRLTEAQLEPLVLRAPIAGTVTYVYRRNGENIVAGEQLITISGSEAERIVAYARQPSNFEPLVGMKLEVRTRTVRRTSGVAEITGVSPRLEPTPAMLLGMPTNQTAELSLAMHVTIPPGSKLRPGEIVDLRQVN